MNALSAWCILRCTSASTIRLADSLNEAGIAAWTPREEVQKVVRGKIEWVAAPLFPSFVFADFASLNELIELARHPSLSYRVWDAEKRRMVTKGHPFFRIFRIGENYRPIPDFELNAVRLIEGRRQRKPRGKAHEFKPGDPVRLVQGAWEGLRGVIVTMKGKTATVRFPDSKLDFQFYSHVLIPDLDETTKVHQITPRPERRFAA